MNSTLPTHCPTRHRVCTDRFAFPAAAVCVVGCGTFLRVLLQYGAGNMMGGMGGMPGMPVMGGEEGEEDEDDGEWAGSSVWS